MSRITTENFDKWAFDYVEGNLNRSQKREFLNFLEAHPELKDELSAWEATLQEDEEELIGAAPFAADLHAVGGGINYSAIAVASLSLLLLAGGAFWFSYQPTENSFTAQSQNSISGKAPIASDPILAEKTLSKESVSSEKEATSIAPQHPSLALDETTSTATSTAVEVERAVNSEAKNSSREKNSPSTLTLVSNQKKKKENDQTTTQKTFTTAVTSTTREESDVSKKKELEPSSREKENTTIPAEEIVNEKEKSNYQFAVPEPSELIIGKMAGELLANAAKKNEALKENNGAFAASLTKEETDAPILEKSSEKSSVKRKHFFTSGLGFFNSRDHQLLHPIAMNTINYSGYSGSAISPVLHMNGRLNWLGTEQESMGSEFSFTQYSSKLKSAFGVGAGIQNFTNQGLTQYSASLYYSPKIKIDRNTIIEPGINARLFALQGSPSLYQPSSIEVMRGFVVTPSDQPIDRNQVISGDIELSTVINAKNFYSAISVSNIISPGMNVFNNGKITDVRTPRIVRAFAGTDFKKILESAWMFSPQISFLHQGKVNEVWLGSTVRYGYLVMGASASQNLQYLGMLGFQTGALRMTYQYDRTKSFALDQFYGSHELNLRLSLSGWRKKPNVILNSEK